MTIPDVTQAAHASTLAEALRKIEQWQLPATGEFYADGTPVSYGTNWGSNGERDFMRQVARDALAAYDAARGRASDASAGSAGASASLAARANNDMRSEFFDEIARAEKENGVSLATAIDVANEGHESDTVEFLRRCLRVVLASSVAEHDTPAIGEQNEAVIAHLAPRMHKLSLEWAIIGNADNEGQLDGLAGGRVLIYPWHANRTESAVSPLSNSEQAGAKEELWAHKEACKRKNAEIKRLTAENIQLRLDLKRWLTSDASGQHAPHISVTDADVRRAISTYFALPSYRDGGMAAMRAALESFARNLATQNKAPDVSAQGEAG